MSDFRAGRNDYPLYSDNIYVGNGFGNGYENNASRIYLGNSVGNLMNIDLSRPNKRWPSVGQGCNGVVLSPMSECFRSRHCKQSITRVIALEHRRPWQDMLPRHVAWTPE
eukprot:6488923-Amphidinium_carterae.1